MTQGTGALLYQGLLFTRNTGGYLIVAYPLPGDNGIYRLASILRCISEPDTDSKLYPRYLCSYRLLAFAWEYLFYAEPDCQSESIVRGFIHPSIKPAQRTSNALEDCSLALT